MQWASKLFGMGLLDPDLEKRLSEAQRQQMGRASLMDAGIAMLANSGYSRMPTSTGQALAAGLGAGRASFAGQAQGMQEQLAAQAKMQQEEQQRQSILSGLDPEIQRFAAGLSLPQLMDVAKQSAGEKAKAMNRAPQTSSYAKAATDMGLTPGTPEHAAMVRQLATQSKAPVTNVTVGAGPSPFDKALASKDAETFAGWRDKAFAAGDTLSGLDALEQINALQQGGKMGEAKAIIGQYFGTDAAANLQIFNAVAQDLVLAQAAKLSGVISDRDMQTLQETLPRYGNDPRANKIIIDILRRAAEKSIANYDAAETHLSEHGDLRGFRPLISAPGKAPVMDAAKIDLDAMSVEDLERLAEKERQRQRSGGR